MLETLVIVLKNVERNISSRAKGERAVLLAIALVVVLGGGYIAFIEPALIRIASARAEKSQAESQLLAMAASYESMLELRAQDPNETSRARLMVLMREQERLDTEIAGLASDLISPAAMTELLISMLDKQEGLDLVGFENSPAVPIRLNENATDAPSISAACTPATDFTYMGERFPVSFILEARNASGAITENYTNGFVKLPATRFAPDSVFHGVEDNSAAPDIDYSSRVQSIDAAFSVDFDDFGESAPGTGSIMGTLVFNRENDGLGVDGAPDGPFILRIGTSITDSDAIGINLLSTDIDVDDGVTEPGSSVYTKLTTTPILFRYGRLLLDNAFGPETEDLEIPVRIEFFDGTEFVLNTDDSCTTLTYNVSSPPLTLVADSYKSPPGTVSPLESGDTVIEEGITTNFTVTLAGGKTGDTNIVSAGSAPDRPFSASAPSGGEVGSAIVELDLGYSSATDPVDFLTYDWRGGTSSTDPYEQEVPDGASYTNNPRAIIEFGSYRSHDRVLSWRELYVMPAE